jgi:hypothetical protein
MSFEFAVREMLSIEARANLASHVGESLGRSDWMIADQAMIDAVREGVMPVRWN